jgi:hypothetical protein
MQFYQWLKAYWKLLIRYLVLTFLPVVLISLGYLIAVPSFKLTHWSNNQESIWSIVESLFIVLFGGNFTDMREWLLGNQFDILLLAIPVFLAFLIALVSLVHRKGFWAKVDLRLSLLFLSVLPVYTVLKPLGYFPRYTWSPLPLALIIIASLLYYRSQHESKT